MRGRDNYGPPRRFPLSIALLSIMAIAAYLLVGGAFFDGGRQDVAVYLPEAAGTNTAAH